MEIGTEIRGALETAFIHRGAAQVKERSEYVLQMRNSEARHEADMKKMATSLQAVTEALMAMKAQPRATSAPAMQPSQAPTTIALQTMAAKIAALTARMQAPLLQHQPLPLRRPSESHLDLRHLRHLSGKLKHQRRTSGEQTAWPKQPRAQPSKSAIPHSGSVTKMHTMQLLPELR